ncbi:MAG: hypothetical protein U5L09_01555 [Bacteroidales bacterium]|nr:hypothetical protein [Bacteroidales bacterium]
MMGISGAFMILAFYSTVAGWTIEYLVQSVGNSFKGQSATELEASFEAFRTSGTHPVMWQLLFMVLTAGIRRFRNQAEEWGIYQNSDAHTASDYWCVMVVRLQTLPGSGEGLNVSVCPGFFKNYRPCGAGGAGQAFFSIWAIGMGVLNRIRFLYP